MRYKIGDKVKLKKYDDLKSMYQSDAYGNIYINGVWIDDGMKDIFGTSVNIEDIGAGIYYTKDNWMINDDMIEPYSDMTIEDYIPFIDFPMSKVIQIKYLSDKIDKLTYIGGKSDWIDLRASEEINLKAGEFTLIPLGVAMKLPNGYEAHIVPRSSTFKNFGIIQTNHMGVIDESYCGDNDEWKLPVYAVRDTCIHINDRICQFRIMEHQPRIDFEEVEHLGDDRGGFGSTGIN